MEGTIIALIVAGGCGSRAGGTVPKQYQKLQGKMLLRYAINAFISHPLVDGVQVVIREEDKDLYEEAIDGLDLFPAVIGGKRRQDSVSLGLGALKKMKCDKVLIHDAARPFVNQRIISDVIATLDDYPAVMPVLQVADTLKKIAEDGGLHTVDRSKYVRAQTPQGFHYDVIMQYHQAAGGKHYTDDIALCEAYSVQMATVSGAQLNGKITTHEDIIQMERMVMGECKTRVGMGFDVHRFTEEEEKGDVMICGIPVPHDHAIIAHSDGDVGLHALVDALLGTIAAGDIGMHFPPSDPQWKDKDSSAFVAHAAQLVQGRDGTIDHVDITIICENPKVRPHVDDMRECIGELLSLSIEQVSVKATTTEKMGFSGRKEGLAAQAVASVSFPAGD